MIVRGAHAVVGTLTLCIAACGGSSPTTPSSPSTPPAVRPQISIQIAPNPLQATVKSVGTNSATFTVSATVTYHETAGASAQITQVSATVVRQPSGVTSTGSLTTSLNVPAFGTASDTYTQDFDVTADVDSVLWRV